jgi:hypothetical protein
MESKMKKLVLIAALGLVASARTANAATWWVLDSRDSSCVTGAQAARIAGDPVMASPFTLAEEMRKLGRLDAPINQTPIGYGVKYDGVLTAFFVSKSKCQLFLSRAQAGGDLPR